MKNLFTCLVLGSFLAVGTLFGQPDEADILVEPPLTDSEFAEVRRICGELIGQKVASKTAKALEKSLQHYQAKLKSGGYFPSYVICSAGCVGTWRLRGGALLEFAYPNISINPSWIPRSDPSHPRHGRYFFLSLTNGKAQVYKWEYRRKDE